MRYPADLKGRRYGCGLAPCAHTRHLLIIPVILVLIAMAVYGASADAVAGKWDCNSTDERGTTLQWVLAVKEEGGKLSATLTHDGDEIPLIGPQLDGNTFTFQIRINEDEIVAVKVKIDGNKLQGSFKGRDSGTGTIKGAKQV